MGAFTDRKVDAVAVVGRNVQVGGLTRGVDKSFECAFRERHERFVREGLGAELHHAHAGPVAVVVPADEAGALQGAQQPQRSRGGESGVAGGVSQRHRSPVAHRAEEQQCALDGAGRGIRHSFFLAFEANLYFTY